MSPYGGVNRYGGGSLGGYGSGMGMGAMSPMGGPAGERPFDAHLELTQQTECTLAQLSLHMAHHEHVLLMSTVSATSALGVLGN